MIALYHGLNPARRKDKFTLPAVGADLSRHRRAVRLSLLVPVLKADPDAAVLVLRQNRRSCCSCSSGCAARLPRFRYDQLMGFAWKFLFPVAMLNLLVTGLLVALDVEINMTALIFFIFAVIAVVCAINVVVQTHPISSALSLVGVMGSLAVLYLLLGAEFIAAAQVIVYAGAIMVLFVFVIMLLNAGAESAAPQAVGHRQVSGRRPARRVSRAAQLHHSSACSRRREACVFGGFPGGTAPDIGRALFTTYLLPFEVTSVLILIAIVGAIVLARKEI